MMFDIIHVITYFQKESLTIIMCMVNMHVSLDMNITYVYENQKEVV